MNIRPIEDRDRPAVKAWMEQDEAHKLISPDIWYDPSLLTFVIEDEEGLAGVFQFVPAMRIRWQFDPNNKLRNAKVMKEIVPDIFSVNQKQGIRQLIFDTVSKPLARFACKYFGFRASPDEYTRSL